MSWEVETAEVLRLLDRAQAARERGDHDAAFGLDKCAELIRWKIRRGAAQERDKMRLRAERSAMIAEIQTLPYLWDGPGSEGRTA